MFESDMELKLADCPEQVAAIVKETIQKVYPHYYPSGAVQFFLDLHSEARIFENYSKVYIDASFPAGSVYLKRGYQIISYEKIETENGDFLCYHTMEKEMCRNFSVLETGISGIKGAE